MSCVSYLPRADDVDLFISSVVRDIGKMLKAPFSSVAEPGATACWWRDVQSSVSRRVARNGCSTGRGCKACAYDHRGSHSGWPDQNCDTLFSLRY